MQYIKHTKNKELRIHRESDIFHHYALHLYQISAISVKLIYQFIILIRSISVVMGNKEEKKTIRLNIKFVNFSLYVMMTVLCSSSRRTSATSRVSTSDPSTKRLPTLSCKLETRTNSEAAIQYRPYSYRDKYEIINVNLLAKIM